MDSPLEIAITEAGGVGRLAEKLGIGQPVVSNWRKRGRVPATQCIAVEQAVNAIVTRYQLRPDIFVSPTEKAA